MSILNDREVERLKKEMVEEGFEYQEFDLNKVDISRLRSDIQEDYGAEANNGKKYILNNELYKQRIKLETLQDKLVFSVVDYNGLR